MRKFYLLLLPAWFILCSVAGFLIFYVMGLFTTAPSSKPSKQNAQAFLNQYNMLIIHVDSLQKEQPEVQEGWMVFITFSHSPSVILKKLDPQIITAQAPGFSSFRKGKNELDQKSTQPLLGLSVPWHGYVKFDDEGRRQILYGLAALRPAGQETARAPFEPDQGGDSLCDILLKSPSFFEHLNWSELIPQHLQTDIELSDMLKIYDLIYHSDSLPDCKEITR